MNKYVWFLLVSLFLILATITADSILLSTSADVVSSIEVTTEAPGLLEVLDAVWRYIGVFFNILLFRVEGFPIMLNLLIFWPLTLANLLLIVSIVRGVS
jgi:hypothetical protein